AFVRIDEGGLIRLPGDGGPHAEPGIPRRVAVEAIEACMMAAACADDDIVLKRGLERQVAAHAFFAEDLCEDESIPVEQSRFDPEANTKLAALTPILGREKDRLIHDETAFGDVGFEAGVAESVHYRVGRGVALGAPAESPAAQSGFAIEIGKDLVIHVDH